MSRSRVSSKTRENLMNEYNKNVDQLHANLRQLEEQNPDSVALERYRNRFYKENDPNLNYNTLRKMNKELKNVLESGATSLDVIERTETLAIETLHKEGYDFIDRRNFNSFMRFLDDARARGLGALYSSTQLISKIKTMRDRQLTKEEILKNMDRWAKQEIKYDKEGKPSEQIVPKRLYIKRYK